MVACTRKLFIALECSYPKKSLHSNKCQLLYHFSSCRDVVFHQDQLSHDRNPPWRLAVQSFAYPSALVLLFENVWSKLQESAYRGLGLCNHFLVEMDWPCNTKIPMSVSILKSTRFTLVEWFPRTWKLVFFSTAKGILSYHVALLRCWKPWNQWYKFRITTNNRE